MGRGEARGEDRPEVASARGGHVAHLRDLLSPTLERLGPKGLWTESRIRKVWPAIVGAEVAANAHVQRLRGSTLWVGVTSDAWATELRFLSETVVGKINENLGRDTVTELVVRRVRNTSRA